MLAVAQQHEMFFTHYTIKRLTAEQLLDAIKRPAQGDLKGSDENRSGGIWCSKFEHRGGQGVDNVEDSNQIHRLEDVKDVGSDAEEHDPTLAAVDPALESHQEADFGTCEIVHFTQVDGEARVLVRFDEFVKPVALAELPVGGVFVRCFKSDDQHTIHVLSCEFEHARVLSVPKH